MSKQTLVDAVTELAYTIKRNPDALKVGGGGREAIRSARDVAARQMTAAQREQALESSKRHEDPVFKQAMFFVFSPALSI